MHALPRWHGESGGPACCAEMGREFACRADAGDDRFVDLRSRAGSDESGQDGAETFREGCVMSETLFSLSPWGEGAKRSGSFPLALPAFRRVPPSPRWGEGPNDGVVS